MFVVFSGTVLLELARLEAVSREHWTHFRGFVPTREPADPTVTRVTLELGRQELIVG